MAEAAAKLEPPKDVKLKDPKDWKIAGKPLKRLDTFDKVTGKQVYAIDFKLPGMLNAAIKESPVFGGKLKSFDAAKVMGMPGVKKVVQVGDAARRGGGRHVVAGQDRARRAADRVGRGAERQGLERLDRRMLKAGLDAERGLRRQQPGDAKAAIAKAAKKVEAVYAYPFQNHATMEPMNATRATRRDKCEVWARRRTARPRSRPRRRRPACRRASATCTTPCSAAASAGARAANM